MTDLPPMEQVAADLSAQDIERGRIVIELDSFAAFCVIGQIQLATRHPANCGLSLENAVRFANALSEQLPDTAQAVIRRGWDPRNDG